MAYAGNLTTLNGNGDFDGDGDLDVVFTSAGGAPVFEADAPATAGPAFLRSDVEVPWSRLASGSYTIRATLVVGGSTEGAMAATVVKK
mgnify:CR=1 FL=1